MKKNYLYILAFVLFAFAFKNSSAQCASECVATSVCNNIKLDLTFENNCPVQICYDLEIWCDNCVSSASSYCDVINPNNAVNQICKYVFDKKSLENANCNCEIRASKITISRLSGNGANASIIITGTQANIIYSMLHGNYPTGTGGGGFTPSGTGYMTDCNGNVVASQYWVDLVWDASCNCLIPTLKIRP